MSKTTEKQETKSIGYSQLICGRCCRLNRNSCRVNCINVRFVCASAAEKTVKMQFLPWLTVNMCATLQNRAIKCIPNSMFSFS